MPRTRNIRPDQAQEVLNAALQRIVEALGSRSGRKRLQGYANEVATYWMQLQWLLDLLNQKPRPTNEQLYRLFQPVLSATSMGASISLTNLQLFQDMLTNTAAGLSGESQPGSLTPKALGRFLLRASSPAKHRRLRHEFVAAYEAREKARCEGREVTIKVLAQQFTPSEYQNNPESALSGMNQGLKRVGARMKRSPEVAPKQTAKNAKTKYNKVHKR